MARQQGDILTSNEGDILIENGDIVVSDATHFHTRDILQSQQGEYKQHPDIGVGIESFTNDEDLQELKTVIRRDLLSDGQRVDLLKVHKNGDIEINSWYE